MYLLTFKVADAFFTLKFFALRQRKYYPNTLLFNLKKKVEGTIWPPINVKINPIIILF